MMAYRQGAADRHYLCSACSSPQTAPLDGGEVTCSGCGARAVLLDRSALPQVLPRSFVPRNDPARLAALREQEGSGTPAALAVMLTLGGRNVTEQNVSKALDAWRDARTRASRGDAAASGELAVYTLFLGRFPRLVATPGFVDSLRESALDAISVPAHRNEILGLLARGAVAAGNGESAERYLSWMATEPAELEADSEVRVSFAVLATLEGDPARVLTLLGNKKDEIPIADSLDNYASAFRANAHELLGDIDRAAEILRELQAPEAIDLLGAKFPSLTLCAQSKARVRRPRRLLPEAVVGIPGVVLGAVMLAGAGLPVMVADDSTASVGIAATIALLGLLLSWRAAVAGRRRWIARALAEAWS